MIALTTPRPEILLRDVEAAQMLGLAPQTLRRWRSEASRGGTLHGPRFLRIGRRNVRYRLGDVRSYLEECERRAACQVGLS